MRVKVGKGAFTPRRATTPRQPPHHQRYPDQPAVYCLASRDIDPSGVRTSLYAASGAAAIAAAIAAAAAAVTATEEKRLGARVLARVVTEKLEESRESPVERILVYTFYLILYSPLRSILSHSRKTFTSLAPYLSANTLLLLRWH